MVVPPRLNQACVAWQWWNYYRSIIPAPQLPLRLNLDETSACLYQSDAGGNILVSNKGAREVVQQAAGAAHKAPMSNDSRRRDLRPPRDPATAAACPDYQSEDGDGRTAHCVARGLPSQPAHHQAEERIHEHGVARVDYASLGDRAALFS